MLDGVSLILLLDGSAEGRLDDRAIYFYQLRFLKAVHGGRFKYTFATRGRQSDGLALGPMRARGSLTSSSIPPSPMTSGQAPAGRPGATSADGGAQTGAG